MSGRVNIGGVEIDVRADGSLLVADLKRAEAQARQFGARAGGAIKSGIGGALGGVQAQLAAILSAGALVALGRQALKAADEFTGMRSRLSLVVTEGENLLRIEEKLAQLALKNRADLGATVSLYTRLRTARKDLDDATTTQILDAWSKTLVISGANAVEAASATLQFSQAMASGRLNGAELSAVLENNTRASRLFADGLGIPIGQLKKFGEEGKLTTEALVGILTEAKGLDDEFAKITMTVGQAGTNFNTAFTRVVGLLDQSTGATAALAGWINSLGDSLLAFGVSLSGPLAVANDAADKLLVANQAILDDTKLLVDANKRVEEAITAQGVAAEETARIELAAITRRIAKNKELAASYQATIRSQLAEAEKKLREYQQQQNSPVSARFAETRQQSDDRARASIEAKQNRGEDINDYEQGVLKRRAEQLQFESDVEDLRSRLKDIQSGINNTDAAALKKLNDAFIDIGRSKDSDAEKSKAAVEALKAYKDATGEAEEALKKAAEANKSGLLSNADFAAFKAGPSPASKDDDKKKKAQALALYTTALEDYNFVLGEIEKSEESAHNKSRATVAAILDYASATEDVVGAQLLMKDAAELLSNEGIGILNLELQKLRQELEDTAEKFPTMGQMIGDLEKPDFTLPEKFYVEPDAFTGYEYEVMNATKRGLFDAISTGDYGSLLENVIGDAATDGLARAVDRMVDILFEALSGFDFSSIFGEGNGIGDAFNAFFSAFSGAPSGRSSGGDVRRGRAYKVGELGAEMFVPETDGYIVPNRSGAKHSGNLGQRDNLSFGDLVLQIGKMGSDVTMDELRRAFEEHRRMLPGAIDARIANRRIVGAY